jgi:DNA/RNA-binding domain of Phe-tRNA-synthetase-like protein
VIIPRVVYPGFVPHALIATLPEPLERVPSPAWLQELLQLPAGVRPRAPEGLRARVRDLLRQRGYRPTGRGKPSSEYLEGAFAEGRLGPINAVVDAGNAVSLHSMLPISVVDLDLCKPPLRIDVPAEGSKFVFNRSGQEIDVGGLLCLFDADGPCANAVKDAQRTKTSPETTRVLAVVWGAVAPDAAHAGRTAAWLRELFARLGGAISSPSSAPAAPPSSS